MGLPICDSNRSYANTFLPLGTTDIPAKMETSLELREYETRIEELRASEKLLAELNETLEMKLKKTEALRAQRLVR